MQRFLNWFFGGLAVGVAVRALARRRTPAPALEGAPQETPASMPAGPVPWYRSERAQTGLSFARELGNELRDDHTTMIAASLAYYAMLSVFPALIAAISIYGLVLSPASLADLIRDLSEVLPDATVELIELQLTEITTGSSAGLGIGAVVSILVTLWTASGGTKSLIRGLNIAYDVEEHRPYLIQRVIAYAVTVGLIVFVVGAVALVTVVPPWLTEVGLSDAITGLIEWLRWPGIFLLVVVGLGLLYKVAPNRAAQRSRWLSPGAGVAAVLWVVATVGLSIYASTLGSFNATYGTLAGVVVLLVWFFSSGFVILLGAELNAVLEHRRDRARRGLPV